MSGTRTAEFPSRETTQASDSGVASIRARTASAPILKVNKINGKYNGDLNTSDTKKCK